MATTAVSLQGRARPFPGLLLRCAILLVPVLAATAIGLLVSELLGEPASPTTWIVWATLVGGAAISAGIVVERVTRRYGPLALLARLSMIFPDQEPVRFRAALRSSSTLTLHNWSEADALAEVDTAHRHADTILTLALKLNAHDRRTRGHCERVRALSGLIADRLGLDEATKERLRWSALLHDVGKMSVPTEILNKPDTLDPEEMAFLHDHPEEGMDLAAPLAEWLGESGRAIVEHHERFDGTGYPLGLAGEEISLAARIVALADAFDTMTSVRSYKAAMSVRAAREEIARCAGTHFDPAVARAFLDLSLPRLWLVVGPVAFLAQVPVLGLALRTALTAPVLPVLTAAGTKALGSAAAVALGAALVAGPVAGGGDASAARSGTPTTDGSSESDGAPRGVPASQGGASLLGNPRVVAPPAAPPVTTPTMPELVPDHAAIFGSLVDALPSLLP